MRFLRSISGIILGFAPVLLGLLFGLLFYYYQTNIYGIAVVFAFTSLGIFLGYKIFRIVQKIGFIAFITALSSTQHIDVQKNKKDE